jgi:hypothetical protein
MAIDQLELADGHRIQCSCDRSSRAARSSTALTYL